VFIKKDVEVFDVNRLNCCPTSFSPGMENTNYTTFNMHHKHGRPQGVQNEHLPVSVMGAKNQSFLKPVVNNLIAIIN